MPPAVRKQVSPHSANHQREGAVDEDEYRERNRNPAQREHYSFSFWPVLGWPSSRRLRSTSLRKSSSNCLSRSPRISTRNESGKDEAGLASSSWRKAWPAASRCNSSRLNRGAYRNALPSSDRVSRPFLNSRSSVVITVVYARPSQPPSTSSRTVALPRAHRPSSMRSSSGPSRREELRNEWKIRMIRFPLNARAAPVDILYRARSMKGFHCRARRKRRGDILKKPRRPLRPRR